MTTALHRLTTAALALLCLLAAAAPTPAAASDPFYESLLLKGSTELTAGDYAAAARTLRRACFGLLDNPPTLANCLTHLAVAQSGMGDEAAFRDTFTRLVEVEQRFSGFSKADIPDELRQRFTEALLRHVNQTTLTETGVFADLIPEPPAIEEVEDTRSLREQLEDQIKAEPDNPEPQYQLARFELDQGKDRRARRQLTKLLDEHPEHDEARLLLGLLEARRHHWRNAAAQLEATPATATDAEAAGAYLGALLELKRYDDAAAFAATLSPELLDDPAVAEKAAIAEAAVAPEPEPEELAAATPQPEAEPEGEMSEIEQLAADALAGDPEPKKTEAQTPPPSPTATATPEPPTPTPTRAPATFATGIQSIEWQTSNGGLVVLVEANGPLDQSKVRYSRLDDPPRYLFRIIGFTEPFYPYELPVTDSPLLDGIRAALHPELSPSEMHVVLDLPSPDIRADRVRIRGRVLLIEVESSN